MDYYNQFEESALRSLAREMFEMRNDIEQVTKRAREVAELIGCRDGFELIGHLKPFIAGLQTYPRATSDFGESVIDLEQAEKLDRQAINEALSTRFFKRVD